MEGKNQMKNALIIGLTGLTALCALGYQSAVDDLKNAREDYKNLKAQTKMNDILLSKLWDAAPAEAKARISADAMNEYFRTKKN